MKELAILIFCMIVSLKVSASEDQPLWFQYADQLVLKYHLSSMKRFPPADDLAPELKNSSLEFRSLIDTYSRERDVFKKQELSNAIVEKMYNTALPESNGKIAYFSRVYLGEYNFDKKGFELCFNKNCESRPDRVSEKFGAKKYELLISNVGASFFISPEESVSKKLESLAAKGTGWNYRAMPAVIVVEPTGTDDSKKWSDGSTYNVLTTKLSGVYLLNDGKFNRKSFPEEADVAAYAQYKQ